MSAFSQRTVAVGRTADTRYPNGTPFHPAERFPECPFAAVGTEPNPAYEAVRNCLRASGLDEHRFGTPEWNPLGGLIRPGETVLLKPNLVKEHHPRDPDGWRYVLTHGSVIRAAADFIWKALEGRGRIVLADAPHTDSSFDGIVAVLGLAEIVAFYRSQGLAFDLVDLRKEEWVTRDAVIVKRTPRPGDPNGYVAFDLAERSEFSDHGGAGRYLGADYDTGEVNYHHSGGRHEYLISGSAVQADLVFSIPKLKTHKKAGITVSLKNLVGINGDKNWLPHHTEGSPENGGDEHPQPGLLHRSERSILPLFYRLSRHLPLVGPLIHRAGRRIGRHIFGDTEEVIRSGNWWGNQTTWRMCLDLNKILLYGNPDGSLRPATAANRKRHFVLVDGIVAGEGRGPMNPDPVSAGLVLFGLNPASVDAASAYLMGFDPQSIPIVRQAFRCRGLPIADWDWTDVELVSDHPAWNGRLPAIDHESTFHFEPHFGWRGKIERQPVAAAAG